MQHYEGPPPGHPAAAGPGPEPVGPAPPNNEPAEESVLGALLLGNADGRTRHVLGFLEAADFYQESHQLIYQACAEALEVEGSADQLLVSEVLRRAGHLERAGGVVRLAELSGCVVGRSMLEHHARLVVRSACARRAADAAAELRRRAVEDEEPPEELLTDAIHILRTEHRRVLDLDGADAQAASQAADDAWALYEQAQALTKAGVHYAGQDTGYEGLNDRLNGYMDAELTIYAARPSVGKTTLLTGSLVASIDAGTEAGFITTEVPRPMMASRVVTIMQRLDGELVRKGRLEPRHLQLFQDGLARLKAAPCRIYDDARHIDAIETLLRRRADEEHPPRIWFIDHLHRIRGPGNSRHELFTEISTRLKDLTVELQVPIVLACQLSRGPEQRPDKRPELGDLRESGAIEENADNVVLLHRPGHYEGQRKQALQRGGQPAVDVLIREAYALCDKVRWGRVGPERLAWVPELGQFADPHRGPDEPPPSHQVDDGLDF